jgi:hypothetical protein
VPRWRQSGIGNAFTAFARRYRLNTGIVEVLDSVIPVAQIDKHWQGDRLDIWGAFGQEIGDGVNLPGVGLVAGDKELLVHRLDVWDGGLTGLTSVHLFTPLQTYDFAAVNPGIWLPWLQTPYDDKATPARLPTAFVGSGKNAALQTLIVNGVPFTTVGPNYNTAPSAFRQQILWAFQDPPIRVHPQQELVVQGTAAAGWTGAHILNVNFYFSEREPQGNVG